MEKEDNTQEISQEEYSKMVNGNTLLLTFEGWIKYIEGFTKGLQTTDKVSSSAVLDCVGEILEYMTSFRGQLVKLLLHCECILQENEELKLKQEKPLLPVAIVQETEADEDDEEMEIENEDL